MVGDYKDFSFYYLKFTFGSSDCVQPKWWIHLYEFIVISEHLLDTNVETLTCLCLSFDDRFTFGKEARGEVNP